MAAREPWRERGRFRSARRRLHARQLPRPEPAYRIEKGSPAFGFHVPADDGETFFYGFPALEPGIVKIAEHTGGDPVDDPDGLDRALHQSDLRRVQAFAARYLPSVRTRVARHAACMYTMTPDEHFVVGLHPGASRVAFAAGLSGHGFKLAPILVMG